MSLKEILGLQPFPLVASRLPWTETMSQNQPFLLNNSSQVFCHSDVKLTNTGLCCLICGFSGFSNLIPIEYFV